MKRLAAILAILLALPLAAHADEASKRAKIDEMFGLLHMDTLMQQMSDASLKQAKSTFDTMVPNADQATKDKAAVYMDRMITLIYGEIGWKSLEPEFAKIYDANFTEAQLDDILAFYKSPTGVVLVQKLPVLTQQGMQIAQARMVDLQPKLKQLIDEMAKDFAKTPVAPSKD